MLSIKRTCKHTKHFLIRLSSVLPVSCLTSPVYCSLLPLVFTLQGALDRGADSSRDYQPYLIKTNLLMLCAEHWDQVNREEL